MSGLVSVIIPCYNSSKYISDTLESIRIQKFNGKIEVILVDDHSNDVINLERTVKQFENSFFNFKLIKSPVNVGGGQARNIGIEASSGDFICFLDSDDIWLDSKLSHQVEIYRSGEILTSKVLKGPSLSESELLPKLVKLPQEPVSEALFTTNKLIQTSTFFMSSDIAKSVKFNPDLPRHQDYDFLLRAEELGFEIVQDDKPTSFWRVEDASSNRFLKKKATPEFFIKWFSEYKKYMTPKAQMSYVSKNIFSACIITRKFKLLVSFLFSGDFSAIDIVKILYHVVKWRLNKVFQ